MNTPTILPSDRTLGITSYNPVGYDPDTIPIASMDNPPEELLPLREHLKNFLKVNAKHWSAATLAQFLGIDIHTLKALAGKTTFNTEKAHTVLVLKPIADAEADQIKYQSNLI